MTRIYINDLPNATFMLDSGAFNLRGGISVTAESRRGARLA